MAERPALGPESDTSTMLAEIARQAKVIEALMNRLERNATCDYRSEFEELQTAVILRGEVRRRTADLEIALRSNELITRQLRDSEFKLLTVINQPLVGISMSEEGRFIFVNQKLADIFGYQVSELIGADVLNVVAECDRPMVAEHMRQRLSGEVPVADYTFRGRRKSGAEIDIELHGSVHNTGGNPVAVTVVMDISTRRQAERRAEELQSLLLEQSIRDPLTGLYNRRYLGAGMDRACRRLLEPGGVFSLVMCDIDHFKAVNDSYGHQAGDSVLVAFARLVDGGCRDEDFAVRYGGEEFLVLLSGRTAAEATVWADALRMTLQAQIQGPDDRPFRVTASFGVASLSSPGGDWQEVIRLADKALYAAKRCGRNQVRSAAPAARRIA